jgi:hypothetical protein
MRLPKTTMAKKLAYIHNELLYQTSFEKYRYIDYDIAYKKP